MFAISFIATAQYALNEDLILNDPLLKTALVEIDLDNLLPEVSEIEDAPFDFNRADYLPLGFNPYAKISQPFFEIIIEEEDAPFDFDTKMYLPAGFDAFKGLVAQNKKSI